MVFFSIGKRLTISALLSNSDFHLPSVDIFQCDENHNMDSTRLIDWIDQTSQTIRKELGRTYTSIHSFLLYSYINRERCQSNFHTRQCYTWHNRLTEETMPPKRSWKKQLIINGFEKQEIPFTDHMKKAELLEIALNNLLQKRYVVDEVAAKSYVQILR